MDLTEALQQLKWLNEERRKDMAVIASLQEQVQLQAQQLAQREAQTQEMQTSLAGIQTALNRVTEFEDRISQFKAELVYQMADRDEKRRREQSESDRLRRIEYEALTEHIHRLAGDLKVLPRYDEELHARRAEGQRLTEGFQRVTVQVADLDKRSGERVQAVAYLEEQRRADNRRIIELETDTTELWKKLEALVQKLPPLEEMIQKQEPRIEAAMQETKKYEEPIEELRISDFQREQKMKQYLDQGAAVTKELERVRSQTQGFIDQQQQVKRSLRSLDVFQARLEKRQNEITEMQRLADERIRRQWEEWTEAQAQQQKKRDTLTGELRRRQDGINDDLLKRFPPLVQVIQRHQSQLDMLWETRRADATHLLEAAQNIYDALVAPIDEQLSLLRGEE
jgi:chromosome segregation ATPase